MRLFGIAHGNVGPLTTGLRERYQPSVNAACDNGLGSRRIFATDRKSKISFLVDTGTDICSYPRKTTRVHERRHTRVVRDQLVTHRDLLSQCPLIGVNFLSYYGLLLDARNKRLIDTTTNLSTRGRTDTTRT